MKNVILFDFDGTIADTFACVNKILIDLSSTYNYKIPTNEERKKLRDHTIKEILEIMHVPFYKLPFIVTDTKKELNKQLELIKPIKGISKLLIVLKRRGYTLALMTSNNKNNVVSFLKNNNLEVFDYIYTGTTLFGKARVINEFLKKYDLTKGKVIYVGDELRDIDAAIKSGIQIIACTWGYNSKKGLKRLNPDYLADKPENILSILDNLNKKI